ncbi:MAG: helix-turn-helix domain-containing protein [Cyclobacteriaceae bacterium]
MKEEEVLSNLLKRIGRKLKELRKKKGYTSHEDFAFDHDIPRVQYWRLEKGQTNLTMKSLIKLLAIHGLTAEEFFHTLYKGSRK